MIHKHFAPLLGFGFLIAFTTAVPAQDVAAGKAMAEKICAPCHAIGRDGASPNPASPPFREIVKKYPVENLEEAFAEGIAVGHKGMPEFTFEPAQIADLLGYLDSLAK